MAKFLRNSLVGILSLSVVGCANFSGDDFKTLGALVLIVGAVAAIAVSDSGDDSNYDSSDNHDQHNYHHDDKHHHHEH
ncbi:MULTISPECIES: hypothetical protein [Hafnia]|uniref:Lipoprotein n=2 Tax=Hafnia TaxID=568 RepID=A0A4Q9EUQ3_9GAMM|nr:MULTISPECIES: hypothetical protein [Hafnia]AJR01819.1 hypothetical protein F652_3830 [Enterobacteriaceae bacterium bta3-1]EHM41372.1 hypothetical protein HMPREF0454_02920 [Hafnia alvei ATCC 51873]OFS11261.1 hypothetical protein HMPREF3091_07195 [Hafnia sp. HMSC23F03]QQE42376.1 hypothetical protein I6H95_15515 [Hafnia alvei]TBM29950.1 hypothetical protein EYY89_05860 [Hafnia paralvei]